MLLVQKNIRFMIRALLCYNVAILALGGEYDANNPKCQRGISTRI